MENNLYYNFNGTLYPQSQTTVPIDNRSFRYGDGVFESMRWDGEKVLLLPFHMERLQGAMQLLQLEGKQLGDLYFMQQQIETLARKNKLRGSGRIRLSVFRAGGGLYTPETNQAGFLLEAVPDIPRPYAHNPAGLIIDIYPDHPKIADAFSTLKSSNARLQVLASLYKKSRGLDDVVILNQDGHICESAASNIFIWYQHVLYTPVLSEGCVDGVMRRAVIEALRDNETEVVEARIDPEILQQAEEVIFTNAVHGIQPVLGYKRKRYFNHFSRKLDTLVKRWIQETFDPEQAG